MDDGFLEAWVNRNDHSVLGRKLHPLCLYDVIGLYTVKSPFVSLFDSSEPFGKLDSIGLADLRLAVLVCSTPFSDFVSQIDINSGTIFTKARKYAWAFRTRFSDLSFETKKFEAYIEDYLTSPAVWEEKDSESIINAPWVLSRAIALCTTAGYSRQEVWTMPIGQALWEAATIAEQNGVVEIISPDEEAVIKEMQSKKKASNG